MAQTDNLFVDQEFLAMRYNPRKDGLMRDLYPALRGMTSDDKVVRFICYMYDSQSPLRTRFPDLKQRKEYAVDLSGATEKLLVDGDAYWPEVVDDIISFLKASNSRLWTMIVTNEETFFEYATRTMDPVRKGDESDDKEVLQAANIKTKLLQDMHDIDARLTSYYRLLTGDDDKLSDQVKVRRMTPEMVAKSARGNA